MYVVPPPNDSHRITTAADHTSHLRTYQTWKGNNVFILQGRFMFGPDVRSVFVTMFLILAPAIVFCIFIARKLMDRFSHDLGVSAIVIVAILTLVVLVLLIITSGTDPGIIPRNLHPPEPESYGNGEAGQSGTPPLRLPRTKDVTVDNVTYKVKYCDTCMLYRPPRCSHCSICNNCVEKFDHHCPWVGQCIGLRNYRFFFMFVSSATLLCAFVFAFCWIFIKETAENENKSVWRSLLDNPASIVLIIYTFISVWFVGGLTFFHLYLICSNQTTYENFRAHYDPRVNVHDKGIVENLKQVFCIRVPPSKHKLREKVDREAVIRPRSGYASPNTIGKPGDESDEARRKVIWNEEEEQRQLSGDFTDLSQDIGGARGSRRSGSWDLPTDVESGFVDSNRIRAVNVQ